MREEGGLDLRRLDAEAAHLDLAVDAAEELEVAAGAPAHAVAGLVEALARPPAVGRGERRGDETLRREVAPPEVAARQAVAGRVELAGEAGRHRL